MRGFLLLTSLLTPLASAVASQIPAVTAVYPSGPSVPERLLRISLDFASPPVGQILRTVGLQTKGVAIEGAFVQQELWSPDGKRLTLLLDPGRVKTGLLDRDTAGPVIVPGTEVALTIDSVPVHRWTVTAGGCIVPEIAAWRIAAPRAGTREALTIDFPGPVDVQSLNLIAVTDETGNRIAGVARLLSSEARWQFTPGFPWAPGKLKTAIHPSFETPCGDQAGEAFEHRAGSERVSDRNSFTRSFVIE